jgi:exopolysaccharide biosynthesis polyprenyl glycosylphosphotransferase
MKRKHQFSIWPVALVDLVLMYAGLWISITLRYHGALSHTATAAHYRLFTPIFVTWLVVFFSYSLFEAATLRRYTVLAFRLTSATCVNALIAVAFFYAQPDLILTPRRFLLLDVAVTFVLLLAWYLALRYVLRSRYLEDIFIYSDGSGQAPRMDAEIHRHAFLGLRFVGRLDRGDILSGKPSTHGGAATGIVLASEVSRTDRDLVAAMLSLRRRSVSFYRHADFYEVLLRRVDLASLDDLWFVENVDYQHRVLYPAAKRAVDVLAGVFFSVLFAVSYPFVALAVSLSSPGPVLFRQQRVGQFGKVFTLYKYRSMTTADGTSWTEHNDPRITAVGKFLRRTRLDELPQALNLLRGDMSLVGPRPESVAIVESLRREIPFYDERHLVKPGLFGWSQLHVYASSIEESKLKLEYDLYYVRYRSPLFDLEIILKTIYYVLTFSGR